MDLLPPSSYSHTPPGTRFIGRDSGGIALFMVLSAVAILGIIVTEFAYIAQVSQSIAFGGLDQAKAHYLAKTAFKLSLLRLKAYQQAKGQLSSLGADKVLPKGALDKIWNFPFSYPIPANIPGIGLAERSAIDKFQKESALEGKFSALIESETSRYSLNPSPGPAPSPSPGASASAIPSFSPEQAWVGLSQYVNNLLLQESEKNPDFATNYRDLRVEDLMDQIRSWADRSYERRTSPNQDKVLMKRAPFYTVSELHMIPLVDEELYGLFAPAMTAASTGTLNVNTIGPEVLRGVLPQMTLEELKAFFVYRDNPDVDNRFTDENKFFEYLAKSVAAFNSDASAVNRIKDQFASRGIVFSAQESHFFITVEATVNAAIRKIEARVTLLEQGQNQPNSSTSPSSTPSGTATGTTNLKITYMRII